MERTFGERRMTRTAKGKSRWDVGDTGGREVDKRQRPKSDACKSHFTRQTTLDKTEDILIVI
jgi:hypothetical protein